MAPLGRRSLSNPVDETWQSLREAVLAHPRISGAKFDHEIKRVDLVTEKTVVGPRRLSAFVAVHADGTQVVIAGAGKRGLSQQVATELLADVSHRLTTAPATEDASPAPLPAPAVSDELSEPRALRVLRSVPLKTRDDQEKQQSSPTERAPRTPPAPPPPPSPANAPQPHAAPPRPAAAPRLASPPKRPPTPAHDALSELADDWG